MRSAETSSTTTCSQCRKARLVPTLFVLFAESVRLRPICIQSAASAPCLVGVGRSLGTPFSSQVSHCYFDPLLFLVGQSRILCACFCFPPPPPLTVQFLPVILCLTSRLETNHSGRIFFFPFIQLPPIFPSTLRKQISP